MAGILQEAKTWALKEQLYPDIPSKYVRDSGNVETSSVDLPETFCPSPLPLTPECAAGSFMTSLCWRGCHVSVPRVAQGSSTDHNSTPPHPVDEHHIGLFLTCAAVQDHSLCIQGPPLMAHSPRVGVLAWFLPLERRV